MPQLRAFIAAMGFIWARYPFMVQSDGAVGVSVCGVGYMAGEIFRLLRGRDLHIEFTAAAQKVEWGAVLGAHVFPTNSDGYDESAACDIVAGTYGAQLGSQVAPPRMLRAVEELLALDDDVPIIEFARDFSSADITRLRKVMLDLAKWNVHPEHFDEALRRFNAEVQHYARRKDGLVKLNVMGLIGASAVAGGYVDEELARVVPLAAMLVGFIVNIMLEELPAHSAAFGQFVDFANSLLARRANPDAVLVARAQEEVRRLANRRRR